MLREASKVAGESSVAKLRRMCALTLALSLASCGDNVTRHPQSERLIRTAAPAPVIDAAPGDPPQRGAAVVAALLDPDTRSTVGTLDEPAVLQFGSVRGAARDRWGKLFVLDGQASELRVFDGLQESGRPGGAIRVVGGEGEGPGQFQAPVALSISAEDSAVAVFESNGRVSLFHIAAGGETVCSEWRTALANGAGGSFSGLRGRVSTRRSGGWDPGAGISRYDRRGRVRRHGSVALAGGICPTR